MACVKGVFVFIKSHSAQVIAYHRKMTWQAKQLRIQPTAAEQTLWKYLRNKRQSGYKFRRQFAIYNYVADFYCHELKLIIEVDGGVHKDREVHDKERDRLLESFGYKILRFSNEQVLNDIEAVLQTISHSF